MYYLISKWWLRPSTLFKTTNSIHITTSVLIKLTTYKCILCKKFKIRNLYNNIAHPVTCEGLEFYSDVENYLKVNIKRSVTKQFCSRGRNKYEYKLQAWPSHMSYEAPLASKHTFVVTFSAYMFKFQLFLNYLQNQVGRGQKHNPPSSTPLESIMP
jgi:hypothetical protein